MYVETRNAKHKKRQHTNKHTNGRRRKAASCRACSVCHCHSLQLSECTQHHNPLRLPTYKRNCGTHARTEQATTQCDDDDDDNDDDDDGDGGGVAMKCCATPIGSLVSTVFECCRATVQSVMLLPSYRARMDLSCTTSLACRCWTSIFIPIIHTFLLIPHFSSVVYWYTSRKRGATVGDLGCTGKKTRN